MKEINRIHFASIDSTNTWAKQNIHTFSPDQITLITAEAQTAGRGRQNRRWESPMHQNIYATFCFFLPSIVNGNNLGQIAALSALQLLQNHSFSPSLKWPNDLLLSDKKVGGVLSETTQRETSISYIIGTGLNINMTTEQLSVLNRPATSLFIESGKLFDVEQMILQLAHIFQSNLALFSQAGFASFYTNYKRHIGVGKSVSFHYRTETLKGTIRDVQKDGSLVLELSNGEICSFLSGEID